MRLLVFSPYYPPHMGGLETHSEEFNKYLSLHTKKITVFTPRLPFNSKENELKHENIEIIRFPAFEIIPNYPLPKYWNIKFWKLFLNLFKNKYDIIISRTRFFNTSLLALIYAKIKRVKWAHIEHGSDFVKLNNKFNSLVSKIYDYTMGKLVLKLSDVNIANSQASVNFCKKLLKNKKCAVIYRGVEIEKIKSAPPNLTLKNDYSDNIIITFIGRLIDGKGVADLIKATADLKMKFKLLIVGTGPQKNNLEKLVADLQIKDRVIFFGHKKFEEAMGILKISDIFVNPSYTEGLPTSVIEAALCKKAIIATDVGGTPEIITNNKSGYLINPRNINSLKEKLELLLKNPELRKKLGKEAYADVHKKFNWGKSINQYLEIFSKILNTLY